MIIRAALAAVFRLRPIQAGGQVRRRNLGILGPAAPARGRVAAREHQVAVRGELGVERPIGRAVGIAARPGERDDRNLGQGTGGKIFGAIDGVLGKTGILLHRYFVRARGMFPVCGRDGRRAEGLRRGGIRGGAAAQAKAQRGNER